MEKIKENSLTSSRNKVMLNDRSNNVPLKILSEADWKFWRDNGYVVIPGAVSNEQAQKTAKFIWEFEEKDPGNPNTWYTAPRAEMQMKELAGTGMVEVYNHQLLWDNRQNPKIHAAFSDIWGTERLWVTIDRANLNFPIRPGFEYKGFIHWDYNPDDNPQAVQGVLALADQTDENMGGFQCIPELYRNYRDWRNKQADFNYLKPDVSNFTTTKVKLKAGDLLIFNSQLPHGIRPNNAENKVRIAQYISMFPADEQNEDLLQWRIKSWKERVAPSGYAFPGDPRHFEQERYNTAELTSLGKRLLGLESW